LVYSALIGQMAQSVVIGLLCSDWSDGSVCCDWSTLLWLVRSSQSVVIGLLCSDWSDQPNLLWLVYSALIGQMAQAIEIRIKPLQSQGKLT